MSYTIRNKKLTDDFLKAHFSLHPASAKISQAHVL